MAQQPEALALALKGNPWTLAHLEAGQGNPRIIEIKFSTNWGGEEGWSSQSWS